MQKPTALAIATAVFMAGICNAFIYTFSFVALVAYQFVTQGSGDGNFTDITSAALMTLIISLIVSTLFTFALGFTIALVCLKLGGLRMPSFIVGAVLGMAALIAIGSQFSAAPATYLGAVFFTLVTTAIVWLALGRLSRVTTPRTLEA